MIRFSHRPTPSYPIKRTNTYHPTPTNTPIETPIETPDEVPQPKPLSRSKTTPSKQTKPRGRPKKQTTVSNTSGSSTDIHTGQPSESTQHDTNTPQDY